MKKRWFQRCMAGLLALGVWGTAQALSITPGRTEVHLWPGQKTQMVFLVKNDHPEKLTIDVTQKNWFLYEANKNITVDQWLKVRGKLHFTLNPGQERKVPVTISCPPKAEGVLIGMTSFTFQTATPGVITPRISASIYLSVDGTEHAAGEIAQIAARISQKTLHVGVQVKATGNMHLRPSGTLTVLDEKGIQAALFRINEADPIYPGQTRSFAGIRQGENMPLVPGRYRLKVHLASGEVSLDKERPFVVFDDGKVQMEGEANPA